MINPIHKEKIKILINNFNSKNYDFVISKTKNYIKKANDIYIKLKNEILKEWNKKKGGKYVIPKKGSKEYNEVKALMK